ncbi:MAG: preprotein translocase subunit SecE [Atopobiaceae bacterium]|nr:preprotein translocase subunit SecE [Atopobiaceae bacterium]
MANKDRQKRTERQARAREREALEAARAASTASDGKGSSKAVAKAAPTKEEIAKKQSGFLGRVRTYFHDVRTEMNRVVWPSKTELKNYSVAVIAMLLIFGVAVWAIDTGFVALLVGFTGLRG